LGIKGRVMNFIFKTKMDKDVIYLEIRTEKIEELLEEGLMIFH
jgi:hypothetical protein